MRLLKQHYHYLMNKPKTIDAPQAKLELYQKFLPCNESAQIQQCLNHEIAWRQDTIRIYGKSYPIPRLQAFQGEPDIHYQYSNLTLTTTTWHPTILSIKNRIEQLCQHSFNCVLINRYRDGKDKMGWHSDNEPELGKNPVIASLSLGAERRFILKHRYNTQLGKIEFCLGAGALLIMSGETQHFWQHTVPSSNRIHDERINLTFRNVFK